MTTTGTGYEDHVTNFIYPKVFLFTLAIALFSYRRRSLQLSGAIASTLIGYLTLANPNPIFGTALLTFFSIGTISTKYKNNFKASIVDEDQNISIINNNNNDDDGDDTNRKKQQKKTDKNLKIHHHLGRDWKQVLCNSWFGTSCAILYGFILRSGEHSFKFENLNLLLLQKVLVSTALTYWAGCAGDTLSSELGILSRSKPRLSTNLREVPAGTNGGVSLLGLGFSILGGILVGGVSCLIGEPHQSRQQVIITCGFFGLFCSVIDSILGATVQQTLYSKTERRVISKRNTPLGGSRGVIIVCGYDWLTNNQVNLISSTMSGIIAGLLSYYSIIN